MASRFNVTTDHAGLGRKLQQGVRKYPAAAVAGINRTGRNAFTFAVRAIQEDTGATAQKTIRRNVNFYGATANKLRGELVARSGKKDRIPIYELKPKPRTVAKRRPKVKGVSYGPQNKLIPGSFVARMKSGHTGIFKRVGPRPVVAELSDVPVIPGVVQHVGRRQRPGGRTLRQQIAELYGPSVALVMSRPAVLSKIKAFIHESLPKEINRAFKFVTG